MKAEIIAATKSAEITFNILYDKSDSLLPIHSLVSNEYQSKKSNRLAKRYKPN